MKPGFAHHVAWLLAGSGLAAWAANPQAAPETRYLDTVKPLLTRHCVACHGPESPKARLRLDTAAGALRGGDSGPAVLPGDPARSLLLQVIDVSMPATQHATVGDGLSYVLQRSGYSLCEDDPEVAALYDLPLPAAHLQLGPIFLRDALVTLAGPAWELQVDNRARQVCFTPNLEAQP